MEKKMTYAQALTNAIEVVTDVETKARLEDLMASLQKRASSKKPTKVQEANEKLKVALLETLGRVGKTTVSNLIKANAEFEGLSTQKVTPLLRQMIEADLVDKVVDKKTTYYFVKQFLEKGKEIFSFPLTSY